MNFVISLLISCLLGVSATDIPPVNKYAIVGRITHQYDAVERVLLNGGNQSSFVRSDGYFYFTDITPGKYSIEVVSTSVAFGQYKVFVASDGDISVIEYPYPGGPRISSTHPIEISPRANVQYFQPRPGFNIFSLLKNPSAIMIVVMVLLLACMPTMMKNMDPEALEELQKQQQMMGGGDMSEMFKNLMGGMNPEQGNQATQSQSANQVDDAAGPTIPARTGTSRRSKHTRARR